MGGEVNLKIYCGAVLVLALGSVACLATTPALPTTMLFCLETYKNGIIAIPGEVGTYYFSTDGGLHWQLITVYSPEYSAVYDCYIKPYSQKMNSVVITDSLHPDVQYQIGANSISRRFAENEIWGEWQTEFSWSTAVSPAANADFRSQLRQSGEPTPSDITASPEDVIIDPGTDNLIVAMGSYGALVRTSSDGQYHWVSVGPYHNWQVDPVTITAIYIRNDVLIIGIFALLNFATIARALKIMPRSSRLFIAITGIIFLITAMLYALFASGYPLSDFYVIAFLLSITFAVGLTIEAGWNLRKYPSAALENLLKLTSIVTAGYVFLYVCWGYGLLTSEWQIHGLGVLISLGVYLVIRGNNQVPKIWPNEKRPT